MRVPALTVALPFLGVFACHLPQPSVLGPDGLYNIDSVRVARGVSKGDSTHWESYRAAADTAASWEVASGTLKNILRRAPSAGGYFDLGLALLKGEQNPEAAKALEIARQLGYASVAEVWCRLAQAYAGIQGNDDTALRCMVHAIQLGCVRPERFVQDKGYREVYESEGFYLAYTAALAPVPATGHWLAFRAGFKNISLPLSIDTNWIGNRLDSDGAYISPYFMNYIPALLKKGFTRIETDQFYYVGKVTETPVFVAFLYKDDFLPEIIEEKAFKPTSPAGWTRNSAATYYLATFTSSGKPIDQLLVAGHIGRSTPVKVFHMNPGLDFTVSDEVLRPVGGGGNLASTIKNTQYFRIDPQGHFVKTPWGAGATGGM